MRRLPRIDRILLLLLSPLWFICVFLHIDRQLSGQPLAWVPVYTTPPPNAGGFPTLAGYWPETPDSERPLRAGDRLLTVGGQGLRDAGHFAFWAAALASIGPSLDVPVEIERDGHRLAASLQLRRISNPWQMLPLSVGLGLCALLALQRGRGRPAARAFAVGALAYSIQWSFFFGGQPWQTYAGLAVFLAAGAFYQPLTLRAALMFPEEVAVRARWPYAFCWLFALTALGLFAWLFGVPLSGRAALQLLGLSYGLWIPVFLGVLAFNYRRAEARGRRQLRWVLYAFYVGLTPALLGAVVFAIRPELRQLYELSLTSTALIAPCLYVAFVRYNLYDINRLITTTIAYSLLGSVALGLVLSIGIPLAEWTSAAIGLARGTILWALAFGLAAPLPILARALRPQIERIFFRDQFRIEGALREIRSELSRLETPDELLPALGRRLEALVPVESLGIFARTGDVFAPVHAAGPVIPPAFSGDGALVALLTEVHAPVDVERIQRWTRGRTLAAVDRAALEALGVEVIVPTFRGDDLAAFVCLGEKRSGDLFTRTELALLESLGDAVSTQLLHLDEQKLVAQQRALFENLAHYAPGAVREEITRGVELAPGQRLVSVLFVDIRGYTTFSESRQPDEIFRVVNAYTSAVSRVIREHGGTVVEFHGDGLLAAFGAPAELPARERAAVEAARAAVKTVEQGGVALLDGLGLSVGAGVATGDTYVGNIQAVDRKIWTVIGNTPNFASRLQSMSKDLNAWIVIDEETFRAAGDAASDFRPHAGVRIRGRNREFTIYALHRKTDGKKSENT